MGHPEWGSDHPAAAAREFLGRHPDFVPEQPPWSFNESPLTKNVTHLARGAASPRIRSFANRFLPSPPLVVWEPPTQTYTLPTVRPKLWNSCCSSGDIGVAIISTPVVPLFNMAGSGVWYRIFTVAGRAAVVTYPAAARLGTTDGERADLLTPRGGQDCR